MTKFFRRSLQLLILTGACAVWAAIVPAQTKTPTPEAAKSPNAPTTSSTEPKPKPTPSPVKLGKFIVTGSLRLRAENWNWFTPTNPAFDNKYTFGAGILRLGIGQKTAKIEWLAEMQTSFVVNLPESSIAPAPAGQLGLGASYFAANGRRDASIFLKQAYVNFKQLTKKASLKVGRFEFNDSLEVVPKNATLAALKRDRISQRLIGAFGFSHVGRSFDAVQFGYNFDKETNLTWFSARPTEGVFQLRSINELDVDLHYGSLTRSFKTKQSENDFRAFFIYYHDGRNVLKSDNRTTAARQADISNNIRLNTVGAHWLSAVKAGRGTVDLLVWGLGQFGSWGNQKQAANAFAVEAGYQFGGSRFADKYKPWARLGFNRSSGDKDPGDGTHGTFFQLLPTPRIYARTPFYNLMNLEDAFAEFLGKPHPKLALRADVHYLQLTSRRDAWYSGGGAFQDQTFGYTARPGFGNKKLGWLTDVSLDYTVSPHWTATFYIARNSGGSVQRAVYPAGNKLVFGYAELSAKF